MAAGPPPHHTFEIPGSIDSSALTTEPSSNAFQKSETKAHGSCNYRGNANSAFQFQWSPSSQMNGSFHTTEESAVKPYVESHRYLFSNDSSPSHDYQQQQQQQQHSYFPARQESYMPSTSNATHRPAYYEANDRYRAPWEPSEQTPATDTLGPPSSKVAGTDLQQQQHPHSLHLQTGHNNNESPNQISSSRLLNNMEGNWSTPSNQYSESAEFSLDFLVPPNALPTASETGILYNRTFDNQHEGTTAYAGSTSATSATTPTTVTNAMIENTAVSSLHPATNSSNGHTSGTNQQPPPSSAVGVGSAFAPLSSTTSITGVSDRPKFNIDSNALKGGAAAMRHVQSAAVAMKLRPYIQQYLLHPDPRALGENTIIVMAGKVAQKSYGTEKRFLCPPPTVILDGLAWNNNSNNTNNALSFQAPKLTVSVSGDSVPPQEGQIDWLSVGGTQLGQTGFQSKAGVDDRNWFRNHKNEPLGGGRSVFKQLYINDADEKRRQMECIAKIESSSGTPIGAFTSRAIKVISKPSKKRQNTKNQDFCIHHGATVSLFNRIRSQTVSTKYLGVSSSAGLGTKQPFVYPGQAKPDAQTDFNCSSDSTCFIARTGSWDPFIIWLVDMNWSYDRDQREKNPIAEDYIGAGSSQFMNDLPYPPPPAVALKNKTGQPIPIHYNQHIVLQCLTTGLVSPVMVIRKVDKAATVVGGASSKDADLPDIYAAYGNGGEFGDEILGDPVSQLHKIALQIIQDPAPKRSQQQPRFDVSFQQPSFPSMPRSSSPVTYLACLNDMVGMHRSAHERRPSTFVPSSVSSSSTDASRKRRTSSPVPSYQHQSGQPFMSPSIDFNTNNNDDMHARKKIRSSSVADPAAQPRLERFSYYRYERSTSLNLSASAWSELGSYWSEDVSDAAVWTIVGTECAKYSFWEIPVEDAAPKKENMFAPTLWRYTRESTETLELYGENFMREMEVWFGDVRSPQTDYRGRERLQCMVPKSQDLMAIAQWDGRNYRVPLLLVRRDTAVVYKTSKVYTFN